MKGSNLQEIPRNSFASILQMNWIHARDGPESANRPGLVLLRVLLRFGADFLESPPNSHQKGN